MKIIWRPAAILTLCVVLLVGCYPYEDRPAAANTTVTAPATTQTTILHLTTVTKPTSTTATAVLPRPTTTVTTASVAVVPEFPEMEQEMANLINQHRAEAGEAPLTLDYTYYECAKRRAEECMQLWSHTRPDGSSSSSVYAEFGLADTLKLCSENLAKNYTDMTSAMQALMNSEGHRNNILHPDFNTVSVCVLRHPKYADRFVMAQLFIKR